MLLPPSSRKNMESLAEDFRKCLQQRAFYHSEFYRRLSGESTIKKHPSGEDLLNNSQHHQHINNVYSSKFFYNDSTTKPHFNSTSGLLDEDENISKICTIKNLTSDDNKGCSRGGARELIEIGRKETFAKEGTEPSRDVPKDNNDPELRHPSRLDLHNSSDVLSTDEVRFETDDPNLDNDEINKIEFKNLLSMDGGVTLTDPNANYHNSHHRHYRHSCVDSSDSREGESVTDLRTTNADDNTDDRLSHSAINNKNKARRECQSDRSNYQAFVPATSFGRFTSCSNLTRCCSASNCVVGGKEAKADLCADSPEKDNSCQKAKGKIPYELYNEFAFGQRRTASSSSLIQHRKRSLFKQQSSSDCRLRTENITGGNQEYSFPCVEKLVKMYTKLLEDKKGETIDFFDEKDCEDNKLNKIEKNSLVKSDDKVANLALKSAQMDINRNSPLSDEGCTIGQSPYTSDYEEALPEYSEDATKSIDIVLRSSSSDSALGFDDERPASPPCTSSGRRMTLTVTDIPLRPALLPLAEPTDLPDSSSGLEQQAATNIGTMLAQTAIPSKVLLEERVVEIPEDKFSGSLSNSRRESAQSCVSDYNSEYGGVRYVRTPSVVVSDYSDDVMCGITLEEIEYFRAHRMRRRSSAETSATEKDDAASDLSAASSCSNLYYCGSTISALDGADCYINGMRMSIDRKISDCSTCSTVSGDEDDDSFLMHEFHKQQNRKLKKVGIDLQAPTKKEFFYE